MNISQIEGLLGPANPDTDRPVRLRMTMLTHGLPKLLGTSHGSMADPMAGSTSLIANVLQLPFAPQLAMFVAILETFGGVMMAVGDDGRADDLHLDRAGTHLAVD